MATPQFLSCCSQSALLPPLPQPTGRHRLANSFGQADFAKLFDNARLEALTMDGEDSVMADDHRQQDHSTAAAFNTSQGLSSLNSLNSQGFNSQGLNSLNSHGFNSQGLNSQGLNSLNCLNSQGYNSSTLPLFEASPRFVRTNASASPLHTGNHASSTITPDLL